MAAVWFEVAFVTKHFAPCFGLQCKQWLHFVVVRDIPTLLWATPEATTSPVHEQIVTLVGICPNNMPNMPMIRIIRASIVNLVVSGGNPKKFLPISCTRHD